MNDTLCRTPLFDLHVELGGRMVEFAGWSLPISFAGIKAEHIHTRTACSVFDVSHMGRLTLTGGDGESFLNRICTRNLAGAEVDRCYYTHICNADGGILDDLIVTRFDSHWGIVCNASNHAKIAAWIKKHAVGADVDLQDETESTAMLAIQGPKAFELAEQLTGVDFSELKRYRVMTKEYLGMRVRFYRTGYTGEDGLEIVVPAGVASLLASQAMGSAGSPHPLIKPAGLGSRDTLRIEAGMPLYGHELSESVDPLSAGQGWCVDLSQDFIGADALRALKEKGLSRKLIGLELDGRRIARQHQDVLFEGDRVGEVTSGTLSPLSGKSIAMAYATPESCDVGTELAVDLGGKRIAAKVVKLPFYKKPGGAKAT